MIEDSNPVQPHGPQALKSYERISPAAYLLAVLWIVLPAVQYMGTVERTAAVTERGASVGFVGTADFSVWYICLAAVTAAILVGRLIARGGLGEEQNGDSQ